MSIVIQFLESMGGNPAMGAAQYAAAVNALEADALQKSALLDRDSHKLNALLGGRSGLMMLGQWAPDSEPLRRDDDQQEGDEPSQDPTPDSEEAA